MLYADGLGAVFAFGGIYAASVFRWGASELGLFGIILTLAGTICMFPTLRLAGKAIKRSPLVILEEVAPVALATGLMALASILVGLGVIGGLILFIVPGIILAIMWHFFGYVIVQDPATGPTDAMRRSAEITRGSRWQLFGLGLLLFGINILGALACGIGIVFTYGITAIAVAYTYKTLSGQPVVPAQ